MGTNSWIANYNQDIFGPDAGSFRPERWLEVSGGVSMMERSYLTVRIKSGPLLEVCSNMSTQFGTGSRTCIGKNISLMEISKVIPMLIRDFDISFLDLDKIGLQTENNWFVKQKGLECRVLRRSPSVDSKS